MKLIKPSFEIVPVNGEEILKRIEAAGRTCYKSENRITETSCRDFVAMIIRRGHETVIEHEKMTVRIICDRGVSHELVRHRIATFSQESTRYCDYNGDHITFVIPPWFEEPMGTPYNIWYSLMQAAEESYKSLRRFGQKPEEARAVLPNSLKTEVVMTANLREWRHFFKLRTAPAAHPQMREIAVPMLMAFRAMIPVVFNDINP